MIFQLHKLKQYVQISIHLNNSKELLAQNTKTQNSKLLKTPKLSKHLNRIEELIPSMLIQFYNILT